MAIEATFEVLLRQLEQLKTELSELRVNAEDFSPARPGTKTKNGHDSDGPPPPVMALADRAAEIEGEIEEALPLARRGLKATRHPRNLPEAQAALAATQKALNKVQRQFVQVLAAYEPIQILHRMARELGQGWPKWAELIQSIINSCRDRLLDTFEALADCWTELADKLATNSVSVQATNIGQQITTREPVVSNVQEFT